MDPAPLADLLRRLPWDRVRPFLAARWPDLPWNAGPDAAIEAAAPRLLQGDSWAALGAAFPSQGGELAAVAARCARPPPAPPAPPATHIGAIHATNVVVAPNGPVFQAAVVHASPQELGFQLARSGPEPELVAAADADALRAALAECSDPDVRARLADLAEARGVEARWDVFVAYASPDRLVADALADALRGRGLRVFIDHRCIPAGALWGAALQSALLGSTVVVVLLSDDLDRRPYLAHEVHFALAGARKGALVPVWKDRPGKPPYGLGGVQAVSLGERGLPSVVDHVVEALARTRR